MSIITLNTNIDNYNKRVCNYLNKIATKERSTGKIACYSVGEEIIIVGLNENADNVRIQLENESIFLGDLEKLSKGEDIN